MSQWTLSTTTTTIIKRLNKNSQDQSSGKVLLKLSNL
jgi:hypothetical protein